MDDTNESSEPKKAPYHPMPSPEEIRKMDEELASMVKAANEYMVSKGWNNERDISYAKAVMRVIHRHPSNETDIPVLRTKQTRLLIAGIKVIDAFSKSGIYKFGDIISKISQKGIVISDTLLIALKRVYGFYLLKHDNPELDDIETVRSFQLPQSDKTIYLRKE